MNSNSGYNNNVLNYDCGAYKHLMNYSRFACPDTAQVRTPRDYTYVLNTPLPPSYNTLQHDSNYCGTYFPVSLAYKDCPDCSQQVKVDKCTYC